MERRVREEVRWVLKWAVEVGGRGGWISRGRGEGLEVEGGVEEDGLGAWMVVVW